MALEFFFKKTTNNTNKNQNNKQTMNPKKVLESYLLKGYVCLQHTHILSGNEEDKLTWHLATSALQKLQVADASYKIKTKIEKRT